MRSAMLIFDDQPTKSRIDYQPPRRKQAVPLHGILKIDDDKSGLSWRVSRGELIKIGLRCLLAAFQRSHP